MCDNSQTLPPLQQTPLAALQLLRPSEALQPLGPPLVGGCDVKETTPALAAAHGMVGGTCRKVTTLVIIQCTAENVDSNLTIHEENLTASFVFCITALATFNVACAEPILALAFTQTSAPARGFAHCGMHADSRALGHVRDRRCTRHTHNIALVKAARLKTPAACTHLKILADTIVLCKSLGHM